jgi:hypothetical protein
MVIWFKTRSQARKFAQSKPATRKAGSVKSDQGWAVLLSKTSIQLKR